MELFFCLRLPYLQFHLVGSWGLLVAATFAISLGRELVCLRLPKPQFYMVLLFHEELLDKKKRFDIVEKVAEG